MPAKSQPSRFWINWLLVAATAVIVFGLLLVVAPSLARQGFSLLVYASADRINTFNQESIRYISLSHAVIGGIMMGWGVMLFGLTKLLLVHGEPLAWRLIALSLGVWFVPDTMYSLISGYWQNALLNTVFLSFFALPLWAMRGVGSNNA